MLVKTFQLGGEFCIIQAVLIKLTLKLRSDGKAMPEALVRLVAAIHDRTATNHLLRGTLSNIDHLSRYMRLGNRKSRPIHAVLLPWRGRVLKLKFSHSLKSCLWSLYML